MKGVEVMNASTIAVLLVVTGVVVFAVRRVRKNGGCNCGSDCSSCHSCPSSKIDLNKDLKKIDLNR